MEDLFYFLLLVAWLVFSFYQQNQKKRRKEAVKAAAERAKIDEMRKITQEVQQEKAEEESPGKVIETIFKTLLDDDTETSLEEETIVEPVVNYDEDIIEEKNIYQRYFESKFSKDQKILDKEFESHDKITPTIPVTIEEDYEKFDLAETIVQSDFDLRSAVIYSEVLKRKF